MALSPQCLIRPVFEHIGGETAVRELMRGSAPHPSQAFSDPLVGGTLRHLLLTTYCIETFIRIYFRRQWSCDGDWDLPYLDRLVDALRDMGVPERAADRFPDFPGSRQERMA